MPFRDRAFDQHVAAELENGERSGDDEQGQPEDREEEAARAHKCPALLGRGWRGKAVEGVGAPC